MLSNNFVWTALLFSSFIKNNALVVRGGLLADYYCDDVPTVGIESIEDVINVFELAIPKAEKTKNGAVYTPKYIRDYILERVVAIQRKPLQNCLAIDIACGCRRIFCFRLPTIYIPIANCRIVKQCNVFYGVDISELSVNRCKILLSLAALSK